MHRHVRIRRIKHYSLDEQERELIRAMITWYRASRIPLQQQLVAQRLEEKLR